MLIGYLEESARPWNRLFRHHDRLSSLLSILASIITMWFSRRREFRADEGGAQLAGKSNDQALKRLSQVSEPLDLEGEFAAFGISGRRTGLSALFLSHPPLEQRIRHLESQQIL